MAGGLCGEPLVLFCGAPILYSISVIEKKMLQKVLLAEYTDEVFFAAIQILLKAAPAFPKNKAYRQRWIDWEERVGPGHEGSECTFKLKRISPP
jgi:hypothetical protein